MMSRKVETTSICISADLKEKIANECERLGVSRSVIIAIALAEYFERREADGKNKSDISR